MVLGALAGAGRTRVMISIQVTIEVKKTVDTETGPSCVIVTCGKAVSTSNSDDPVEIA
jgi:hypothetical protein